MSRILFRTILFSVFLCIFSLSTNAQKKNIAAHALSASKKTTVIVVGQTAKLTYKVTKFTVKRVAKPIIVKSAPKTGKFVLKQTGNVIKRSYPFGKMLFIKYVKYKFLP